MEVLKRCGILEHTRAETLGLEDFLALAQVLEGVRE
jgi:16S rRNA A1518/A1519 N6-dimethyltransferase RsmA/KsgA/DIM1 with predicted DNA glycosylase/AP lyase activity